LQEEHGPVRLRKFTDITGGDFKIEFQLISFVTSFKNIILQKYVRRTYLFVANEMSGKTFVRRT